MGLFKEPGGWGGWGGKEGGRRGEGGGKEGGRRGEEKGKEGGEAMNVFCCGAAGWVWAILWMDAILHRRNPGMMRFPCNQHAMVFHGFKVVQDCPSTVGPFKERGGGNLRIQSFSMKEGGFFAARTKHTPFANHPGSDWAVPNPESDVSSFSGRLGLFGRPALRSSKKRGVADT